MKNFVDDIKLGAFDVFAYLLPGSVLLGALAIFNWAFFYHAIYFLFLHNGMITWTIFLVLAYLFGYIAQGIGEFIVKSIEKVIKCYKARKGKSKKQEKPRNWFQRLLTFISNCFLQSCLPEEASGNLKQIAKDKFKQMLNNNNNNKEVNDFDIYYLCVAFIEQHGSSESRKMLQHMQGMSLGLAVSFFLLFLSLIFFGPRLFSIISLIAAVVSIYRYKLFDRYRQRDAILSFLAISANLEKH